MLLKIPTLLLSQDKKALQNLKKKKKLLQIYTLFVIPDFPIDWDFI